MTRTQSIALRIHDTILAVALLVVLSCLTLRAHEQYTDPSYFIDYIVPVPFQEAYLPGDPTAFHSFFHVNMDLDLRLTDMLFCDLGHGFKYIGSETNFFTFEEEKDVRYYQARAFLDTTVEPINSPVWAAVMRDLAVQHGAPSFEYDGVKPYRTTMCYLRTSVVFYTPIFQIEREVTEKFDRPLVTRQFKFVVDTQTTPPPYAPDGTSLEPQ